MKIATIRNIVETATIMAFAPILVLVYTIIGIVDRERDKKWL